MDTLPPEIIGQILTTFPEEQGPVTNCRQCVWRAELAQFSTISRVWQASVEQITFRSLSITTSELDVFVALFNGENISRRAALTSLMILVILPNPGNAMGCCPVVRTIDREADSAAFSTAVVKLFTILADLEARASRQPPLTLTFSEGVRPSRLIEPRGTMRVPCPSTGDGQNQHSRREVLEAKAMFGQFELLHEDSIPSLHDIGTLVFQGYEDLSDLKPTWISGIVPRLPKLRKLLLWRTDSYNHGRQKRQTLRERK
jgi:hypothetical protein